MGAVQRSLFAPACLGFLLAAALAGCHSASAPRAGEATPASLANPNAVVESPKLTKQSVLGGPMPPQARKIFEEKMAQVAEQSEAAHAAARSAGAQK